MRVDARLPADCDLAALDCGWDMGAVLRSCGSEEGRRSGAVYSQGRSACGKHRPGDRGRVKQAVETQGLTLASMGREDSSEFVILDGGLGRQRASCALPRFG